MRYFYIFILTLILISCNEKKGYSTVAIEYGDRIQVSSVSECRNVVEKGKILSTWRELEDTNPSFVRVRILHKGFIYVVNMHDASHICFYKRKFHDK